MRKVLLVGVKKTTNIGFIEYDVGSAGYDETEAGFQITAEISALNSFSVKVSGKSATSTKFVYFFYLFDLDEFHFVWFEKIKDQRNSAAMMTQFPISITLN